MPFPVCSKKQREETGSIISSRGREGPGIIPLPKTIINDEEVIHPKESQSRWGKWNVRCYIHTHKKSQKLLEIFFKFEFNLIKKF